jgi:hypothetical protein
MRGQIGKRLLSVLVLAQESSLITLNDRRPPSAADGFDERANHDAFLIGSSASTLWIDTSSRSIATTPEAPHVDMHERRALSAGRRAAAGDVLEAAIHGQPALLGDGDHQVGALRGAADAQDGAQCSSRRSAIG